LTSTQAARLAELIGGVPQCPGYALIPKSDFQEIIPAPLGEKCIAGLLMTSTGADGTTYAVLNLFREDHNQIDQHPLCSVLSSTGAINCIFLIDHANHEGRTQYIPPLFSESSTMRLVSGCLSTPHSGLSSKGPLSDLMGTSNANAFQIAITEMIRQLTTRPVS
jgi:hypothetical protein